MAASSSDSSVRLGSPLRSDQVRFSRPFLENTLRDSKPMPCNCSSTCQQWSEIGQVKRTRPWSGQVRLDDMHRIPVRVSERKIRCRRPLRPIERAPRPRKGPAVGLRLGYRAWRCSARSGYAACVAAALHRTPCRLSCAAILRTRCM